MKEIKTLRQLLIDMAQRYIDLKQAILDGDKDKIIELCVCSLVSSEEYIAFADIE